MKKVLIITYHWPPAGGPGVQRILKFTKFLPYFNWYPIVLTVESGEYPAIDHSLEKEICSDITIYKSGSIEPGFLYKKFTGMKNEERIPTAVLTETEKNIRKKLAHWIRLNLFIPDAKIGWLPFAVHKGKKIIKNEKPDLIFSSSPPPTSHLIARKLKKYSGLKWIADFRDPWTDIHYYESQPRLKLVQNIDNNLELSVLLNADKIVSISKLDIDLYFKNKINKEKCINIPNGYDESDFTNIKKHVPAKNVFTIIHLGAAGKERNPEMLFKVIQQLDTNKIIDPTSFQVKFIGKIEQEIINSYNNYSISEYITSISYLPHKKALKECLGASLMLLLITRSKKNIRILPGKTFEYMRIGRPILSLGPKNGEVARILKESKSGEVIDYQDYKKIYNFISTAYQNWRKKGDQYLDNKGYIYRYERKNLTKELAMLFNEIAK